MAESKQLVAHFSGLSNELIVQILHFCRYNEILKFAATSKRHHSILLDSVSLKLHIELEANGLDIVNGSQKLNGSYSRSLDELVRYRDAWLNLDFEEPDERNSNQVMSLWELREGNYVVAFSSMSSALWGPDSIQITPVDPLEPPQPITFPSIFSELTLDFEQGLAALVTTDTENSTHLEVRLCSTTTGMPHPLARNPIFTVQVDFQIPGPGHQTFTLEVVEDILVIRIADIMRDIYEIIAWDWKSSALLCRIGSSSGIADFAILDNRHLALFSVEADEKGPHSITLSLYFMLGHAYSEASRPHFYASKYACARPILTFEFPKLDHSYIVSSRIIMRSDPIPGRVTYTKSVSFAHQTALTFSVILSLLRLSSPADTGAVHLRIFISAKSLLSYLPESTNKEHTTVIPYHVWGINATRWFLCDKQTSYWVYWTSGSRFISVNENPQSLLHSLSIFDFHSPTVKRHAHRDTYPSTVHQYSSYEEEKRETVLYGMGLMRPHPVTSLPEGSLAPLIASTIGSDLPTVITTGFATPVESRLPYRVVTRPNFAPLCEDWSIDGNHIIGMTPVRRNVDRLSVYKLRA
ncbi:unnamed protein product [Rhizoctonia solani]|uniref:F-box domain-containing protein n=1 Tax=Rhizoctonia solani TaxID=456999 RepID=A0A8H3HV51_9AGAM|nr:unnamed protein product [Rhizoctonia solani]